MRHKSQSYNLIAEMTFHDFCHILLVGIMSPGLVCIQREEISQEFEYQGAGVVGSHVQKLATRSPKAVLGELNRYEVASATMIPSTILD